MRGQAGFAAPKQRNSDSEKADINAGRVRACRIPMRKLDSDQAEPVNLSGGGAIGSDVPCRLGLFCQNKLEDNISLNNL